jgi:hypothetical protein
MAPPRQRPAQALDDSRSEASSSTRERQGTACKGRRPANPPAAATSVLGKEMKPAAAAAPANGDAEQPSPLSGVGLELSHRFKRDQCFRLYGSYDLTDVIARD